MYNVNIGGVPVDWNSLAFASIPTTQNADWDAVTANWTNNGYRLPTEMEWMWAAMGATSDRSNGYKGIGINTTGYTKGYAGSTEISGAQVKIGNYAWTYENSTLQTQKTHPVGGKLPNELGLYDMSGNVCERIWDRYADYLAGTLISDATSGRGAATGTLRIIRGGCWNDPASFATIAYQESNSPHRQGWGSGIRVVRQ